VKKSVIAGYVLGLNTALVFLFLLAPVLVVVVQAFNTSPLGGFPLSGLTLKWFGDLASDDAITASLRVSLILAFSTSVASTILGTAAALALARNPFRGRRFIELLLTVPILVPHIVLGVGLLLAFRTVGLAKSFPLMIAGHVAITLPFVVLTTRHRLQALPPRIEEAAQTLGANGWQVFMAITLPLSLPAILASAMFAFMSSFDEVTATLFWLPPDTETLPSRILAMLQYSVDQKINALASGLILASLALAGLTIAVGRSFTGEPRQKRGPNS
jgi:spermidine/putrescine transport system permease protein